MIEQEKNINVSFKDENNINASVSNIDNIPSYRLEEEKRRSNEEERINNEKKRETYYNQIKKDVASGLFKGEQGDKGEKGDKGEQGEKGETGPQGIQGDKGEKGLRGETGPQGIQGDKGEQGPRGETGPQGIQGEKGNIGPQGLKGDSGPANTISIGTVESGEVARATMTGTSPNQTLNLVLPQGEKGDKGDKGEKGEKGDTFKYFAGDNINIDSSNAISAIVPTKTSELYNDSGFINDVSDKQDKIYFVITEDIVTVVKDSSAKGVSPYSTSYYYTNITINEDAGIEWIEGAQYYFIVNSALIVTSTYRNVRVRIGEQGDWKPLYYNSAVATGSSFFTKAYSTICTYKSTYQTNGALHILANTFYSTMSQTELNTGTATTGRLISAYLLKTNLNNKQDKESGKGLSTNDYTDSDKEKLNGLANYDDTEVRSLISNKQDKGNYALKTDIPSLTNYYTKEETYTQSEVNSLVSTIPKFDIKVVDTLPTDNISSTTVYLVLSGTTTKNLYTEYIYVNNDWEELGTQSVDLSDYYNKSEIDEKINEINDKFIFDITVIEVEEEQ